MAPGLIDLDLGDSLDLGGTPARDSSSSKIGEIETGTSNGSLHFGQSIRWPTTVSGTEPID
jgi:hypothetical protein